MHPQGGNWLTAVLPFVIIAIVVAIRLRSMNRERPLNLGGLWIVPAIYLALVASMLFALPPPPLGWGVVAVGLGYAIWWPVSKLRG